MKCNPTRWLRDLAPIPIATDREVRIQLVEVNGQKRVSMGVWCKGGVEWHRMPGVVQIPVSLLGELHNRLTAAMTS